MYLLGYDIGSSSVKASLVEAQSGQCVASAFYPKTEAEIKAVKPGWAEQEPDMWWQNLKLATQDVLAASGVEAADIKAIGISYQMHGLVCVDKAQKVLRPAIIWCDSRAVPYGDKAFHTLGEAHCLSHLLNSPGNFTASKLAWVKENEPELFAQIDKIMLPGDYIAMRLSGTCCTTVSGLSEGMLWDFQEGCVAQWLLDYFGFPSSVIPPIVPTFSEQGRVSAAAAVELGLAEGIPITYRAGDQPNNALSLNVFNPGEIASTAGTSGVVYGVNGTINYDSQSRVNTFAHVNHTSSQTRLGVLLCINGTGILNAWMKRNVAPEGISYEPPGRPGPHRCGGGQHPALWQRCRAHAAKPGARLLHPWHQLQPPQPGPPAARRPRGHRLLLQVRHRDYGADGHPRAEDSCRTGQYVPQPHLPPDLSGCYRSHHRAL